MSKNFFIGVNGVARKGKNIYVGVDGVAKQVKTAYVGVNDIARRWYQLITPEVIVVPESTDKDSLIEALEDPIKRVLLNIEFQVSSAILTTSAQGVLRNLTLAWLEALQGHKLVIEGHASVDGWSGNQALSEQRALSVMNFLISCELPSKYMTSVGYGQSRPSSFWPPNDPRQRRVEVVNYGP